MTLEIRLDGPDAIAFTSKSLKTDLTLNLTLNHLDRSRVGLGMVKVT